MAGRCAKNRFYKSRNVLVYSPAVSPGPELYLIYGAT